MYHLDRIGEKTASRARLALPFVLYPIHCQASSKSTGYSSLDFAKASICLGCQPRVRGEYSLSRMLLVSENPKIEIDLIYQLLRIAESPLP